MFVIPVLTIFFLFWAYQKKNKKVFGPISYLLSVYCVMGLFSIILEFSGYFTGNFKCSFGAMVYLSVAFIVIFYGFFNYKDHLLKKIVIENTLNQKIVENILLVGGFGALFFFIPFAYMHLLAGEISEKRIDISFFVHNTLSQYGLVNSFASLFANLFPLSLVFSFVNFIKGKKFYLRAILLYFSSTSYIVYTLAYLGRDGFVYWVMMFIFIFLLFKPFLNSNIQRRINRIALLIVLAGLIPFIIITEARFGNRDLGVFWYIVRYAGEQIQNFNDRFQFDFPDYGRSTFPFFVNFFELIGIFIPKSLENPEQLAKYFGYKDGVFRTYIGSFVSSLGKIGTLMVLIFMSISVRNILRKVVKMGCFYLSDLIIFVLFYQIVLFGVFYFRQSTCNSYIIAMLCLYFFFKFFSNNRKKSNSILSYPNN